MKIPVLVSYVVFRSAYDEVKKEILNLQFSFPYHAIQFFNKISRYIPKEYIDMDLLSSYLGYGEFGRFLKQVPRSMFSRLPSNFVVDNSCIVIRVNEETRLRSLLSNLPKDYFCDYAGYNLDNYNNNNEIKIIKALGMSYEGVIRFEK